MEAAIAPSSEGFEQADTAGLRTPPSSTFAEQAVIGGLLIDNGAWDRIAGIVGESDFYFKENRALFREISALAETDQPFDVVTLSDRLQQDPADSTGVLAYLATLANETPSAANITAYAGIVREKSVRRRLIGAATGIIENAYKRDVDEAVLLDRAEQSVFEIASAGKGAGKGELESMAQLSVETYDRIEHLRESGPTGLKTGFSQIDDKTFGLEAGELVVIAGRPSMGKTSFALNIVENVVLGEDQKPAAIFSMEMSARQIAMRFFSSLGRISQGRLRTGKLHDEEWPRLTSAMKMLQTAPIYVDDTSTLTPLEIHTKVRRLKRRHQTLGLVMVDYLQLMQTSGSSDNRTAEISQISRSMKALAREIEAPVLALSQLNRGVEQRQDKRPMMSDLRESGAIEQDADLILLIYRDEVYHEDTADKGIAEIRIAKQRNGPLFTSKLTFLGQFMRFENLAPESAVGGARPSPESAYADNIGL